MLLQHPTNPKKTVEPYNQAHRLRLISEGWTEVQPKPKKRKTRTATPDAPEVPKEDNEA